MELAIEDIGGVIGQSFLPFIQIATDAFRLFGDILANIIPNFSEVQGALAEFRDAFADFGAEIRNVLADIGPMIRDFLIDALREVGHWLSVLTRVITILVSHLRLALGGAEPGTAAVRSSVGASAQAASITSLEGYENKLAAAAFSMPGTKGVPEQQLDTLKDMALAQEEAELIAQSFMRTLDTIGGNITDIKKFADDVWEWLQGTGEAAKKTAKAVVGGLEAAGEKTGLHGQIGFLNKAREYLPW
jgi:phage-related protein